MTQLNVIARRSNLEKREGSMWKFISVAAILLLTAGACGPFVRVFAQSAVPAWAVRLDVIRSVASMIPGQRPQRLNVVKFAESRRPKNFSVKGAPADPSVQARTAFQVVYTGGTVMVDAGMDQQVHRFFGRGIEEPYDTGAFTQLERALKAAKLIVVTHEHGDHVAGVIHGPLANDLAPKTILTRAQVQALTTSPQMPEIRLTEETTKRYSLWTTTDICLLRRVSSSSGRRDTHPVHRWSTSCSNREGNTF